MKLALSRAQLVYDVALNAPAFDIAAPNAGRTLQTIYGAFSGRFKISLADVSVSNAVRLSDWAIRLLVFGGRISVEFRFDGCRVTCNLLSTAHDIQRAVECIHLAEHAARTLFTSSEIQATVSKVSAWFWCDGGAAAVPPHLAAYAPAKVGIVPGFQDAQQVLFNVAGGFGNPEERWLFKLLIEPSAVDYGHLFVQMEGHYAEGGKYNTFDEKSAHFSRMYTASLNEFKFEVGDIMNEGQSK